MLAEKIALSPIVKKEYIAPKCQPRVLIKAKNRKNAPLCIIEESNNYSNLILENGKNIGSAHYTKKNAVYPSRKKFLPKSWIETGNDGKKHIKPFLWIDLIFVDQNQKGLGYGKSLLRHLYETSVKNGCEGRMMGFSAWDSYNFYAKSGWEIYINTEERCKKAEKKLGLCTRIKDKISKYIKTPFLDKLQEFYGQDLSMLKSRLPYQDEEIIFNPTEENVKKLFG